MASQRHMYVKQLVFYHQDTKDTKEKQKTRETWNIPKPLVGRKKDVLGVLVPW
jgi:hypothetical protein